MKLDDGLEANVFASEEMFPELINPVQMATDTDGRIWVATWPSYPHWNPTKPMDDKILIFPDEDRDGKADRQMVFADKLNSVTGFEFWGGGVLGYLSADKYGATSLAASAAVYLGLAGLSLSKR